MKKCISVLILLILVGCSKHKVHFNNGGGSGYSLELTMKAPQLTPNVGITGWDYEFNYDNTKYGCITFEQDSSTMKMIGYVDTIPVVTLEWYWYTKKGPYGYYNMTEQGPTNAGWLKGRLTILNSSRGDTVKLSHYPIQIALFSDKSFVNVHLYTVPDSSYDNRGMAIEGDFYFPRKLAKGF